MSEGWMAAELSSSAWLAWWRRVKRREGRPLYKQLEELAQYHGMATSELAHGGRATCVAQLTPVRRGVV